MRARAVVQCTACRRMATVEHRAVYGADTVRAGGPACVQVALGHGVRAGRTGIVTLNGTAAGVISIMYGSGRRKSTPTCAAKSSALL